MKKIFYLFTLSFLLVSCTALDNFNKKLENIHNAMNGGSSSSTSGTSQTIISLNSLSAKGKGKVVDAKLVIKQIGNTKTAHLEGYYINTSNTTQNLVMYFNIMGNDGYVLQRASYFANGIAPNQKFNLAEGETLASPDALEKGKIDNNSFILDIKNLGF